MVIAVSIFIACIFFRYEEKLQRFLQRTIN